MKSFGHFADGSSSYIVDVPDTPRAFDNFLWNDSVFSCVLQTGVGYCDVQIDGTEGVKLYTGEGRICDIEVFGRETLLSRLIYIRDNESGKFWNVGWEPVRAKYESYSCEHGLGFTRITSVTDGVKSSLLVFIPAGSDPVELWKLELSSENGKARDLTVFVYNQYGLQYKSGFNSYGDMLYRGAWFDKSQQAMIVQKHPFVSPHNHLTAFLTADRKIDGFDGSRDKFVGLYNTMAAPQAVIDGKCTNMPGSSESTIGVLQFNIELKAGETLSTKIMTGLADAPTDVAGFREKHFEEFDEEFNNLLACKKAMISKNEIRTPDNNFNRLVNAWMKQQTLYGAVWGRWGWMGYRDVVQHSWGVSSFDPARAKSVLSAALEHLGSSGLAVRGWNPVDTKPYSDSAVWLVFSLCDYLKETGDFRYLDHKLKYFDKGEGTVFEHIDTALNFLNDNKGAHGILLIKFGDWNDSLTGIGKGGKGESVWLTMAVIHALHLMTELCRRIDRNADANRYDERAKTLTKAVRDNAWDGKWFVRCFDDEGSKVGSAENAQGRIYVNAQSWAIISGVANREQIRDMMDSCDKLLLTDQGYRLVAPPYMTRDDHIGRISYLEPGICENGTIYSHGNAFLINALLRDGQGDKAYDTFKRVTPGYIEKSDSPKLWAPPYVYSNCYYGPEHRNRAFTPEFTWITGSVSWFLNSAVDWMIGVRREYDGLTISPVLPSEWSDVFVKREFRGKKFNIRLRHTGNRTLMLNGTAVEGDFIALSSCSDENEVVATW